MTERERGRVDRRASGARTSGSAVVAAYGLTKWYGLVLGVSDIDLDIGGGTTGLLGPNGAGKSTFLKLMTGQIRASRGEVRLLGETVWNNPKVMARVGYCPEQDAFYGWMSGLEFVTMLLRIGGYSRTDSEEMAEASLRLLDMGDAMDRRISGYSKGMRQRVKVAQAIADDPDLLILDEPLSGTDPVGRARILEIIRRSEREGRNVVLSSHVLHDVERTTRNIVLINRGKVIAEGDVHAIRGLIDQYPHMVRVRTEESRRLAGLLAGNASVVSLEFQPGVLVVKTSAPDRFYGELPRILTESGIRFTEISSPDDNLDAVFRYLVE